METLKEECEARDFPNNTKAEMSLSELQGLCQKMLEIKDTIKEYKDETSLLNGQLSKLKAEAIEHLEKHDLKNFDHGAGKIIISNKKSVKILDKYKFFDWLKSKDMFEDIISVPAATATRIYNEEYDRAKDSGDIDFLTEGIDGLSEPNVFTDIRFLK